MKTSFTKTIMMGDFNGRTGEINEYIVSDDNEDILRAPKNEDKKVNTSGRL